MTYTNRQVSKNSYLILILNMPKTQVEKTIKKG